ncbi:hypothetical protein BRADI_1g15665v3 [Brachypodium distachyon]|uniref:Uncharacterized protein n=1 Tax=Brachypodium distachyon TaxID=15368 RepID=A0A0Q3J8Z9_BRADI|nr:hypothetical protein BRADI_1g15665v3 [Brachypodium distachyon]
MPNFAATFPRSSLTCTRRFLGQIDDDPKQPPPPPCSRGPRTHIRRLRGAEPWEQRVSPSRSAPDTPFPEARGPPERLSRHLQSRHRCRKPRRKHPSRRS